jgi:hypothetical protein
MAAILVTTIQRFIGLSTDAKPTGVSVGSELYETNTKLTYVCYDGTNWAVKASSVDLSAPGTIGDKTPAPVYASPSISKGPAIVNSGFLGTIARSTTTLTFSNQADATLAGWRTSTTDSIVGTTVIHPTGPVTMYITAWLTSLTCTVDSTGTLAAQTPTSVQLPQAVFLTSTGAVSGWVNAAGVTYFVNNVGIGTILPQKPLDVKTAASVSILNTDASNYERLTFTGVQGASVNVTAETAGTGGDNLDVVITPAGTGALKSVTKFVHSGTPDIVSSAGAISVQTAITHVVTNGVGTVLTLAAGVEGQVKYIVLKTLTSGGQTDVITPDGGGAGFTTITMAALGQAVTLLYTNGKWTVVGSFGVVIA